MSTAIKFDPLVSPFESPEAEASYDRWFRAKVEASLANTRPMIPHDEAMARLRAAVEAGKAKHAAG